MPNTLPYSIGQQIRCRGIFKNELGQFTDPTTITFRFVHLNTGTITTYVYPAVQVVKVSTGSYYVDIIVDKAGIWVYGFQGVGAVTTADEKEIIVRDSYLLAS